MRRSRSTPDPDEYIDIAARLAPYDPAPVVLVDEAPTSPSAATDSLGAADDDPPPCGLDPVLATRR